MGTVRPHPTMAIRRWLNTPPNLAKFTLGFLVVMNGTFAIAMCLINDVVYRYCWPVWFGLAAAACLLAVVKFDHVSTSLAGAFQVTAFIGRTVAVAWSWQAGLLDALPAARVVVTLGAWISLAFMSALIFFRGLLTVSRTTGS